MNGYFQLINGEGQTKVCLYPPLGGGSPIDMNELVDYLNFNGIKFSIPALYSAAKKVRSDPYEVTLSRSVSAPIDEVCRVRIPGDGMRAIIRFYPPSNDGASLKRKDITSEIEHRGVRRGIVESVLEQVVKERDYCTDYEIALGEETSNGEDARIEYSFEHRALLSPDLLPDKSVDLRHLYRSNRCFEGDVVARLIPATLGRTGFTVRGEEFPGTPGKDKNLRPGRNIVFDPETGEYTSKVTGRVKVDKDRILATPLMEMTGTASVGGNISYEGSILIEGDVESGAVIKATGDVIVSGQAGAARIDSGGDVVLCQGMDGRGKGIITAKSSVFGASFVNCAVRSGRDIYSDVFLNANAMAANIIRISGPRGIISGGMVSARNGVFAKVLGNDEGRLTIVETGRDPALIEEIRNLESQIEEREGRMEQAYPVLQDATGKLSAGEAMTPSQLQGLKELHVLYNSLKKEQKKDKAKLTELKEHLSMSRSARVEISSIAYPGTKLSIGDGEYDITERMSDGCFLKERDEVVFVPGVQGID